MSSEECICHWYEDHRCSGDPEFYQHICQFITDGLCYAKKLYGEPRVQVREVCVVLRPCQDPETVITDRQRGIFTIFISRGRPNGGEYYWFYGQLAHEIAHLLNAELFDCYVEGLNSVFSRNFCISKSVGWACWRNRYRSNRGSFYAATYFMMKDVLEVAGEECISTFLECAKPTEGSQGRMHIDINQWLKSLPDERKRKSVKEKIMGHASSVERARQQNRQAYQFRLPTDDS